MLLTQPLSTMMVLTQHVLLCSSWQVLMVWTASTVLTAGTAETACVDQEGPQVIAVLQQPTIVTIEVWVVSDRL
jgi:hypothetical protein